MRFCQGVTGSALFVTGLLVSPAKAVWPKRGLAWNDGIPIQASRAVIH